VFYHGFIYYVAYWRNDNSINLPSATESVIISTNKNCTSSDIISRKHKTKLPGFGKRVANINEPNDAENFVRTITGLLGRVGWNIVI